MNKGLWSTRYSIWLNIPVFAILNQIIKSIQSIPFLFLFFRCENVILTVFSDVQIPSNNHLKHMLNVFNTCGHLIMIWFPQYTKEFYEYSINFTKHTQIGNVFYAAINMTFGKFTGKYSFEILHSTQRTPTPELLLRQWDGRGRGESVWWLNYKESFLSKGVDFRFEIHLPIDSYHLMPNLCSFLNDMLIKIAIWRIGQRCQSIQSKPVLV